MAAMLLSFLLEKFLFVWKYWYGCLGNSFVHDCAECQEWLNIISFLTGVTSLTWCLFICVIADKGRRSTSTPGAKVSWFLLTLAMKICNFLGKHFYSLTARSLMAGFWFLSAGLVWWQRIMKLNEPAQRLKQRWRDSNSNINRTMKDG